MYLAVVFALLRDAVARPWVEVDDGTDWCHFCAGLRPQHRFGCPAGALEDDDARLITLDWHPNAWAVIVRATPPGEAVGATLFDAVTSLLQATDPPDGPSV